MSCGGSGANALGSRLCDAHLTFACDTLLVPSVTATGAILFHQDVRPADAFFGCNSKPTLGLISSHEMDSAFNGRWPVSVGVRDGNTLLRFGIRHYPRQYRVLLCISRLP